MKGCFLLAATVLLAAARAISDLAVIEEIDRRVARAGGATGALTVSLSWGAKAEPSVDLDLHLFFISSGTRMTRGASGDVHFRSKRKGGFELDVDMCTGASTSPCPARPVENIVFKSGLGASLVPFPGKYGVLVRRFGGSVHYPKGIPFEIVLSIGGRRALIGPLCTRPRTVGADSDVRVVEFIVQSTGRLSGKITYQHKAMRKCPSLLRADPRIEGRAEREAIAAPQRSERPGAHRRAARAPAASRSRARATRPVSASVSPPVSLSGRDALATTLRGLGLAAREAQLRSRLGVESVSDLELVEEADLDVADLDLTALQRKRLLKWAANARSHGEMEL